MNAKKVVPILAVASISSGREEAKLVGLGIPGKDVPWGENTTNTKQLKECIKALVAQEHQAGRSLGSKVLVFFGSQCHGMDKNTTRFFPISPVKTVRSLVPEAIVTEVIVSHACASTGIALGMAADACRHRVCDTAIVCAASTERGIEENAFREARALGTELRPFDIHAEGTRVFEFAGAVLVRGTAMNELNAGEVIVRGWSGRSVGGRSGSDPQEELCVMDQAIDTSGITPQVVLAHGTGTQQGDAAEIEALEILAEQRDVSFDVFSNKGAIGHAVFGAGVASAATALRLLQGVSVSGTIGLRNPRETSSRLNLVFPKDINNEGGYQLKSNSVLLNCFGFSGSNTSIILERIM